MYKLISQETNVVMERGTKEECEKAKERLEKNEFPEGLFIKEEKDGD